MLIAMTAGVASAQTGAEHDRHHPADAASVSGQSVPGTPEQQLSTVDRQVQLMREMRRKLAEATTPQERQAVMGEHHRTMQDSMTLLGKMQGMPMASMGMMGGAMMMGGAGMPGGMQPSAPGSGASATASAPEMGPPMARQMMQRHAMMEKRMEMMETMMQMMMDRTPAP